MLCKVSGRMLGLSDRMRGNRFNEDYNWLSKIPAMRSPPLVKDSSKLHEDSHRLRQSWLRASPRP